jgi:hypothetical protein
MSAEYRRSFLTLYKRLNFLIKVWHTKPNFNFQTQVRMAFKENFTGFNSIFSDVKTYKWDTKIK